MALVGVILVSCTGRAAPSPTPATNLGFAVPSLAPSPTPSATIAATRVTEILPRHLRRIATTLRPESLRHDRRYLGGVKLKSAPSPGSASCV